MNKLDARIIELEKSVHDSKQVVYTALLVLFTIGTILVITFILYLKELL